jgi:acetyltransferase-like isoleucine patch superfamily enzyme
MSKISSSSLIYPNVQLGEDSQVGEFVIVGEPPRGVSSEELETVIGPRALIRSHSVIYSGNHIGSDFQSGHGVMIRESNQIGDNVSIGTHSVIEHHVVIGNNVRVHSDVFIPEYCLLEDECWIGPAVVMTNAEYPRSLNVKEQLRGAIIRKGAKVGAGVILLPGVTIGRNALIGAGAVVVQDVEDDAVMVGNPARFLKRVSEIPEYASKELE